MIESSINSHEELPYHDDGARLYYNTGNKVNVEKRTRSTPCQAGCNPLTNVPEDSLQGRFRYFKQRNPAPNFKDLQTPNFKPFEKYNRNIDSWMFDLSKAQMMQTDGGLLICKNIFSKQLLEQLASEAVFQYPIKQDNKNNLVNINRTIEDKLTSWKSDYSSLRKHPLKGLRWVTMGCHHNWLETTPGDPSKAGPVPKLMTDLGTEIGKLLNFERPFLTEASIINYYPANTSTIGIHRDDIVYQIAPIMTISLGCPGLFLIGSGERDEKCFEVLLEHGDLCILDGSDRSAFHAVPRIIDFELAAENNIERGFDNLEDKALNSYLLQSRINISLRQISET